MFTILWKTLFFYLKDLNGFSLTSMNNLSELLESYFFKQLNFFKDVIDNIFEIYEKIIICQACVKVLLLVTITPFTTDIWKKWLVLSKYCISKLFKSTIVNDRFSTYTHKHTFMCETKMSKTCTLHNWMKNIVILLLMFRHTFSFNQLCVVTSRTISFNRHKKLDPVWYA